MKIQGTVLSAFVLAAAAGVAVTAGLMSDGSPGPPNDRPTFLSQPYTLQDRALDQLREDARSWANLVEKPGRDWSTFETGRTGVSVSHFVRPPSLDTLNRVVVGLGYTVQEISGNEAAACSESVQMAARSILGIDADDLDGNSVRRKRMLRRFGTAAFADTAAAKDASRWLIDRTVVKLRILEMATRQSHSCTVRATG